MSPSRALRYALLAVALCCAVCLLGTGPAVAEEHSESVELAGNGTAENPYEIRTVEQLEAISADLDARYVLASDINASQVPEWEPVGPEDNADVERYDDSEVFTGTFDGQGHTIRGLTIDRPDPGHMGVFKINRGTIENVTLGNTTVTTYDGRNYPLHQPAGTLVGTNQGRVANSTVVNATLHDRMVGGVVGRNDGGVVSDVEVRDLRLRYGDEAGGVAGIQDGGVIQRAAVTDFESDTARTIGGVVGELDDGTVRTVGVDGALYGYVGGGVIGEAENATVEEVYATARVEGELVAGGVVGNSTATTLASAYGAGRVRGVRNPYYDAGETGDENITGGVVASANDTDLRQVYWDRNRTGQSSATANRETTAVGLATAEMVGANATETMSDLDFQQVWTTSTSYPVLRGLDGQPTGELQVLNLRIPERVVVVNETASVEIVVANRGPVPAVYEPPVIGRESLTTPRLVAPGGREVSNLTWKPTETGGVTVTLDDYPPQDIDVVSDLSPSLCCIRAPRRVLPGEEYEVKVSVDNPEPDRTVTVRYDSRSMEKTANISFLGRSQTVVFTVTAEEPGTTYHRVTAGDARETEQTKVLDPGTLVIESLDLPAKVAPGEEGEIAVTVRNDGNVTTTAPVDIEAGNQPLRTEQLRLSAGETATLAATYTVDQTGAVEIRVETPSDRVVKSVTVDAGSENASVSEPNTNTSESAPSADDGGPGFGIVVAGLAALLVATRARS